MRNNNKKNLWAAVCILVAFAAWTVLIRFVDVREIGPLESSVGFATVNGLFHNLTGVHMSLYHITDWLGLVPIGFVVGFAVLGLAQWIKRKSFLKVDASILVLGGFYIVVMAAYLLFEEIAVNYRPVLINGYLEASYPSSTTMLVLCVMLTSVMQFNERIKKPTMKRSIRYALIGFTAFMVVGRLLSGVHWLTDIIGGAMLSAGLVLLYRYACGIGRK